MRKIVLVCAQGMSTGMLVNKMKAAAKEENYECSIDAHAVASIAREGKDADCILIGPQVRYELDNVKKQCPSKPVAVIDMVSYGRLDGKKVLADAKKMIGD